MQAVSRVLYRDGYSSMPSIQAREWACTQTRTTAAAGREAAKAAQEATKLAKVAEDMQLELAPAVSLDLANMEKKAPKGKVMLIILFLLPPLLSSDVVGHFPERIHGQKELRSLFRAVVWLEEVAKALGVAWPLPQTRPGQLFTELEELAWNGNLGRDAFCFYKSQWEFISAYARPGLPVIITGLNITEEEPWSLEFFKRAREAPVVGIRRLEFLKRLPLAEFIDSFTTNATRRKWYLHVEFLELTRVAIDFEG
ncbi:hypothetical protein AK812_SmicGene891 [Symbiodinium microadriaticum]|uniref:Uncharacterized protein n=1 Tax=Symbiodinium microadriaticum TaxID=2951 RepID=A0A1Q9F5C2_SYMMI|nr:hypothetical protein AK812_SmicGene891 [Symbiodinium microadriaticum]